MTKPTSLHHELATRLLTRELQAVSDPADAAVQVYERILGAPDIPVGPQSDGGPPK